MAFIKLHKFDEEILINTIHIYYIEKYEYEDRVYPKCNSLIYFKPYDDKDNEDANYLYVYETLEEIENLINKSK